MSMKNIFENFRTSARQQEESLLNELETREGFRNYKLTFFLKIDKKSNIDVSQIFSKIRAIPGVITLKQEKATIDKGTHFLSEVTVKYNSRGMPTKNYIL